MPLRLIDWKPLTLKEAYTFLGILIHMGGHREPKIEDYWSTPNGPTGSVHGISRYMGLRRFQAIHAIFTASSNSLIDDLEPFRTVYNVPQSRRKGALPKDTTHTNHWDKVEPLASHIRHVCQASYTPGSHVTIDEIMMAFRRRSDHTTKLKNKPISEGFKNWVREACFYIRLYIWVFVEACFYIWVLNVFFS